MVCFEIMMAYPLSNRKQNNAAFDTRMEHLRKHYRADSLGETHHNGYKYVIYAMCDEDAIAFLRDVPYPTVCVSIKILRSDILLYSNYKITRKYVEPPHHLLLKKVYWRASQLQKWHKL